MYEINRALKLTTLLHVYYMYIALNTLFRCSYFTCYRNLTNVSVRTPSLATVCNFCFNLSFPIVRLHCFFTLYTFNCVFVYVRMYTCAFTCADAVNDHTLLLAAFLSDFSSQYLCSDIIYRMLILRSSSFYPYVLPNCTPCTIVLIVKIANFFVISIRVFNSG